MSDLLTHRDIAGVLDDDHPLTDTDTATAVHYALKSWRGPALLEDDPNVTRGDWATGGSLADGRGIFCIADGHGVWVRITSSDTAWAGHISWRAAKTILRAAQADDGALFSLEA